MNDELGERVVYEATSRWKAVEIYPEQGKGKSDLFKRLLLLGKEV